jgi:hypothetical protein
MITAPAGIQLVYPVPVQAWSRSVRLFAWLFVDAQGDGRGGHLEEARGAAAARTARVSVSRYLTSAHPPGAGYCAAVLDGMLMGVLIVAEKARA